MLLTQQQQERYARHLVLKDFGEEGQAALLHAKVLVIGAGGLGSPVILYLAASGIGTIGIADADCVDVSNLQRQIIHNTERVGVSKVASAISSAEKLNPDVRLIPHSCYISSENIGNIIRDYDFIMDCTDNFDSKFLINDACVAQKKPFSHAGILGYQGQLMTYIPGKGPCYRCIFEAPPPKDAVPTGRNAGVIGALAGVIGSLQAMEAIRYFTGIGELLTGTLLTYDARTASFRRIPLPPVSSSCPVCNAETAKP
ncbi:MAG: HesA/MoeB/ThiF family protein [Oscillospiraceae bacterium]|nr:HesA/MoeB/ThiF family protein [Oscillospiraceae bacterium]